MLVAVQGVYRKGRVEIAPAPSNIADDTPVIVTFLVPDRIDLRTHGIDETQARDLRDRLQTFIEDWDSLEMSIYDSYDAAKAGI